MSQTHSNTTLSISARLLLYIGPPSAVLLTFSANRRAGLFSPLAFAPATLFYLKWRDLNTRDPSRRGGLEPMLWILAATSTIGITLVGIAQYGIVKTTLNLLFGANTPARKDFATEAFRGTISGLTADQLAHRVELARSWQNWVYNAVFTFLAAGLVEESLKYIPIAYARHRGTPKTRKYACMDYAIAGALGFGLTENIGFIYAACAAGEEAWYALALTVIERLLLGASTHALTAGLMAARALRRDFCRAPLGLVGVVGPSIFLHGFWDLMALGFSAMEGNVGWIHPQNIGNTVAMLGSAGCLMALAGWQIIREWTAILRAEKLQ